MPTPLLNAYAEMLPRLIAEESLLTSERVAVGSGSLKRGQGRQIAQGWMRQTDRPRDVIRPKSKEMYHAQMAMAGIGVKKVKVARDG